MSNPIVTRACMAFQEAYGDALVLGIDQPLHAAMEEMLVHFAGELLAIDAQHHGIRAHQVARLWFAAAREGVEL